MLDFPALPEAFSGHRQLPPFPRMLFNTYAFLLGFLPLALAGYTLLGRVGQRAAITFLFIASCGFYSVWDIAYLPLLLGSITVNYLLGKQIALAHERNRSIQGKRWLIAGVLFNIGLLGFYKYADFIGSNTATLLGLSYTPLGIALPIGISFFTFTQLAFLVDCHAGSGKDYQPASYGLFVTYFPHLIAGPILHHKDMMPQFADPASHRASRGRLVVGGIFLVIGLFKKIVIADGVASYVAPVFDLHAGDLTTLEAWCGALAYTFQLYFDFSAYCDMAYGLSYLFGIILPINFNSPYKATSIIDFWRRWHITLSSFLRDYLYIPLGGNRCGPLRRHANLMLTMLLGGLWHGANWTFVIWGGLHGLYLVINHAIQPLSQRLPPVFRRVAGWTVTLLAVVVAWVFFRAAHVDTALRILGAMAGGGQTSASELSRLMDINTCLWWLAGCAAISLLLPNLYQLLGRGRLLALEARCSGALGGLLAGVLLTLGLILLAISETRGASEFLYFNF